MLALTGTLALPDMCAALESDIGTTTGARYKAWVSTWIAPEYADLDADELWRLRCSMIHQGRSETADYERIIFVAPNSGTSFHNNVFDNALNLDLPTFCGDVMDAVRRWETSMQGNANYELNIQSLMRWHPKGLSPYIVGVPVLS